jgi:serine phosphatase RsbU (regulator of sigma subunit)/integral membrane sensor domain MASE1
MVKDIVLNLIITIAYILAAKLGFFLAFLNTQVSPIWPPEGVGFFAIALMGRKIVPGVFLGAFLANFLNNPHIPTAFIIGIGNTASSFLNIWIMRKFTEHADPFLGIRSLAVFVFFGTIPGSLISASLGVGSLFVFEFVSKEVFWNVFFTWFAGEMQGFIIVGPFLLTVFKQKNYAVLKGPKSIEFAVLILMTILLSWKIFSSTAPLIFFPFLFTVYLSLRFRNLGAVSGGIIISILAVYHTIQNQGPFSLSATHINSLNNSLIFLDIFLFTKVILGYFVVVLLNERDDKNKHLLNIQMITNLELERKVRERTKIIAEKNKEFEYQIKMARAIQSSLLPKVIPQVQGFDLAYEYVPMMDVGGDFLDIQYFQKEELLSVFICDVSGHGIASAFIATMAKMSLSHWYENPKDVVQATRKVHQNLAPYLEKNFITACFVTIDIKSQKMHFTSAGHVPILVMHKNNSFSELTSKGRVIFSFTTPDCELGIYDIQKGDQIIFYTDGITESRPAEKGEDFFGLENLSKMLIENKKKSAKETSEKILEQTINHSGGIDSIQDDLTILILKTKT